MGRPVVSQADLAAALRRAGVGSGDALLLHSSLRSMGWVEGGAAAVVRAFLEVLGTEGLLVVPTLPFSGSQHEYVSQDPLFDPAIIPACTGTIPETVRTWPGACRSCHPTHSVAALGDAAADFVADHCASLSPFGPRTPYGRLVSRRGKVVLLGVPFRACTLLHLAEELAQVPYLFLPGTSQLRVREGDRERAVEMWCCRPGLRRAFDRVEPLLRQAGCLALATVGSAELRVVGASPLMDVVVPALRENPLLLLADRGAWP